MTGDVSVDTWRLDAWDEALGRTPEPHPFALPHWQRAWWDHFACGELHVLVLDDGAHRIGVAPVHIVGDGVVAFLGGDLTDYPGPILAAADADIAADLLLARLDRDVAHWREFTVHNARPATGMIEALGRAARRAGHRVAFSLGEAVALLELPSRWEDHMAALGRHRRHELRRKEQRFARAMPDAHVRTADAETLAGDVETFVALHRRARGEKATFMTAAHAAFFRRVAEDFQRAGWLRLDLLEHRGHVLAATFGFQGPNVFYLYNMAFDPADRALTPGIVLLGALVRRSIADGLRRFDFLRGLERYKLDLGAAPSVLQNLQITRRGAAAT